jgi:hypothetical protein
MYFRLFSGDKDSRPDWIIVSASESALGLGGPSPSPDPESTFLTQVSSPLRWGDGETLLEDSEPEADRGFTVTAVAFCPACRAAGREDTASTSLIAVVIDCWVFRSSFSEAVADREYL